MPVTRSKQVWMLGNVVNVGFLRLKITHLIPTPGDGRPDTYKLVSLDGVCKYLFTPHCGLERVD